VILRGRLFNAAVEARLRAKVQEALDDPRPPIPHDHVMAEVQAIIDGKA
jgi:DNA-damage-inducible protein J